MAAGDYKIGLLRGHGRSILMDHQVATVLALNCRVMSRYDSDAPLLHCALQDTFGMEEFGIRLKDTLRSLTTFASLVAGNGFILGSELSYVAVAEYGLHIVSTSKLDKFMNGQSGRLTPRELDYVAVIAHPAAQKFVELAVDSRPWPDKKAQLEALKLYIGDDDAPYMLPLVPVTAILCQECECGLVIETDHIEPHRHTALHLGLMARIPITGRPPRNPVPKAKTIPSIDDDVSMSWYSVGMPWPAWDVLDREVRDLELPSPSELERLQVAEERDDGLPSPVRDGSYERLATYLAQYLPGAVNLLPVKYRPYIAPWFIEALKVYYSAGLHESMTIAEYIKGLR